MSDKPSLPYRRILLTRMKFIGDVVLLTPAIRSVRLACPDAHIAFLGDRQAVSLLEGNPNLDEVIPFDFGKPTLLEQPKVMLALVRRRFDLAIDFFGNPRSALLTYTTGARVRVGPERKGRGRLYTIRVKDDGTPKTAIEFHNQSLRAAGIEPSSTKTEIFLSEDEKREAGIYLRWLDQSVDASKPIVALHPGATWPAKKWLPERFGALADLITAKLGARVIVTEGPGDAEAVASVMTSCTANVTAVPVLPLRQLAAVISRCSAFVSNDCGPMHIAAALGTPTIGIFGPGEENIWFPYDMADGHHALRKDVPCHPCHLDFCNREGDGYMECMKLLEIRDVFDVLQASMKIPPR